MSEGYGMAKHIDQCYGPISIYRDLRLEACTLCRYATSYKKPKCEILEGSQIDFCHTAIDTEERRSTTLT